MKQGKRYAEVAKAVDRQVKYSEADAISMVKKNATAKFDETVELHIRTGCDGRHADQQVRGSVVLPAGTGKNVRILVFAKDAKADEALAAGADFVGADDLVPRIQGGWFDGCSWTYRTFARTEGLDAEPEARNRYDGCSEGYRGY